MFRVLIADDDAGFRKAVGGLLQAHLPTTVIKEASSGQEMLQQLNSVDLLFLDISLAGEKGLELTARLKSQHPDLAVSILTIHDSRFSRISASGFSTRCRLLCVERISRRTNPGSRAIRHRWQASTQSEARFIEFFFHSSFPSELVNTELGRETTAVGWRTAHRTRNAMSVYVPLLVIS
ncbi:MAG: response regulator [Gammaproteobacteria bacterium]